MTFSRFPTLGGETAFALRAWDADAPRDARTALSVLGEGVGVLGPVEDFTPGAFAKAHLVLSLPVPLPAARAALEEYLRGAYVPFSLWRDGEGYGIAVPPRGLKKKVLFGGHLEGQEGRTAIVLEVGPKFDLLALHEGKTPLRFALGPRPRRERTSST